MNTTQQLFEEVRTKLGGVSTYKVAQVLDIPRNIAHYYELGERSADAYACAKIAEILDRDPLEVIAQVEAEAARTEKKRAFWQSFFSGLKRTAHVFALCGMFAFSTLGHVDGGVGNGLILKRRQFA